MKIGIVNNGIGNVGSVLSALRFYAYDVSLLEKPEEIQHVDMLVLAGVGSFASGVSSLQASEFWEPLQKAVMEDQRPLLGLCLGMHLFATLGYENGEQRGFGWIPGKVVRLKEEDAKVPHIGWAETTWNASDLSQGLRQSSFYFMHSYHFLPENPQVVVATALHGSSPIAVGVRWKNVVGLQFHPEKSQGDGLRLLRNVVESFDGK